MAQSKAPLIDEDLVRQLVTEQFPLWASLEIAPVPMGGHDNRSFRLGSDKIVRLPSAAAYALHVETEQRWLPILAPQLSLEIPTPIGKGKASEVFPFPWTISQWIEGETLAAVDLGVDQVLLAQALADFLNLFAQIDASNGPHPGKHNFYRGGDLVVYDAETRDLLEFHAGRFDAVEARRIWDHALSASKQGPGVWIHGDMAVGNLLVREGQLGAVIDFGQMAVGDRACDLTIAWTYFSGKGRVRFKECLDLEQDVWSRARGWALWKAMLELKANIWRNELKAAGALAVIEVLIQEITEQ